jgi:hypothetical protein
MENVYVDAASGAVFAKFSGVLTFAEHKALGEAVLAYAKSHGLRKALIDTSEIKVIRQETQKWIAEEWFPNANMVGLTHMAFLVPSDVFGKMSTKSVNQKAGNIDIQNFDDLTKARVWIKGA